VAVPETAGRLLAVGEVGAVKEILGAVVSATAKATAKEEKVGVDTESVLAKDSWYWIYRCVSVTQLLEEISLPDVMAVHVEKAGAPLIPGSFDVLTFTASEVLLGVVALYVAAPHNTPLANPVSKIDEVSVPEVCTWGSSAAKVCMVPFCDLYEAATQSRDLATLETRISSKVAFNRRLSDPPTSRPILMAPA
jgi:hypothetical protein